MIDAEKEAIYSLPEFADKVLGVGHSTVLRWVNHGAPVVGREDETVTLDTITISGRRYTSMPAYWRFVRAQNPVTEGA